MDGFSTHFEPPPEYNEVKWISDLFVFGMGLGWGIHYVAMTYVSLKDRTYCLNIMALCADFAWEIVYCFVYPSNDWAERTVIFVALLVNLFVMYAAIRATPNEWQHSPLIMQNALPLFVASTALWLGGMLAMAAQLGPARAYSFGAITLWLSRFLGSISTIVFVALRYFYWREAFSWIAGPFVLWTVVVFFASELIYGYCFYRIRRQEAESRYFENKGK